MWTLEFLIQLITSFVGTLGFAMMFRLHKKYLLLAAVGGTLTFFVYHVVGFLSVSVFAAAFTSSAVSAVFSELLARWKRAPAILFILPCAIPIVPGGSLYRTMFNLISKETEAAWSCFAETITIAIGIAGGLAAVSLVFHIVATARAHFRAKRAEKESRVK